ncbi:MAG: tetratricopeptide repeat protein, partial [Rhodothermales bacterium]
MKVRWICIFLIGLVGISTGSYAQSDDPLREGILAFRDGRFEEAARVFERVTERDPARAEAYFLLARVYTETPLKDRRKADRALGKALEIDPDNLTFLVGRLQHLREESWNFFTDRIRESKRLELARKILALDSTNAFAHEELGVAQIRDFWRYRNAISLPGL